MIERLAQDLRNAFPDMKGFSRANLMYMRAFAEAWPDVAIVQQGVGQLPWGHNLVLLTKLKTREDRLAYTQRAIEHGWSRNVLVIQSEALPANLQTSLPSIEAIEQVLAANTRLPDAPDSSRH